MQRLGQAVIKPHDVFAYLLGGTIIQHLEIHMQHALQHIVAGDAVLPTDGIAHTAEVVVHCLQNIASLRTPRHQAALIGDAQHRSLRGLYQQADIVVVGVAVHRQQRDGGAVAGDGRGHIGGAHLLHQLLLLRRQVAEIALEAVGHAQPGGGHSGGTHDRHNGGDQQPSGHTAGLSPRRTSALLILDLFHRQLLDPAEVGRAILRQ